MKNFQKIKSFFVQKLAEAGYDGIIGVARFKSVYNDLMPIQRVKLEDICGEEFRSLMESGFIICIGIAFPEYAIDSINVRLADGTIDKNKWNS